MAIPISYNVRNLVVRKTTTVLTVGGIALTVAVLVAVLALVEGLRSAFEASGRPLNVLVMRKGSTAELMSVVTRSDFQVMKFKPGIATNRNNQPMASLEMVTMINNLGNGKAAEGMNINLRGLTPIGIEMRDQVHLISGRFFEPGKREIIVGKNIAARYPKASLGSRVRFGRGQWDVVGVMDGGRSSASSEIYADLNQISADYSRTEYLSAALIRASDPVAMQALRNNLEGDPRFNISTQSEREYYESQMVSATPVRFMGLLVCVIMAVGSSFAAMNTMYAAVARRSADIGMLRVLGFSRAGILTSFLVESVILSVMGGAVGCLLALPLNNFQTRIGSFVTFSEISFSLRMTPEVMAAGVGFGMLMGVLGGFFPARSAAKKEILAAFRAV
ncbi:MAG: ABC transporter permease [Acidobacteriia bacterium]|nr:ABC transporter permease [Terriglobia bacterium]